MNKCSLVVPVYNKMLHLERLITNIYSQSRIPDEVIFVDDCSNDYSPNILQRNRPKHGYQIIQHPGNKGASAARNSGINAATSPLIALLDADDSWHPDFLSSMLETFDSMPEIDMLGSGYYFKNGDSLIRARSLATEGAVMKVNDYFEWAVKADLPFTCSSVVVRKHSLIKSGLFDQRYTMGEDQVLWNRLVLKGHGCFVLNDPLSYYHLDIENSSCMQNNPASIGDYLYAIKEDSGQFSSKYKNIYLDQSVIKAFAYATMLKNTKAANAARTSKILNSRTLFLVLWLIHLIPTSINSAIFKAFYKNYLSRRSFGFTN